ncbi:hypothetical protein PPYR_10552 [Photinus pyralis]|uniref:Lipocalin/cytosolic fatty-acid binding domain-containing protein n=1 Tax=Photinus pyralis TaxID=7054 RepID=A0A1Y1MWF7_PHOPY|nr:uncharacterized protein LOC116173591 [Photinus pyralis]KAB0796491.1 hypothetical protein PPYR_10552 [Photinus pyralis]
MGSYLYFAIILNVILLAKADVFSNRYCPDMNPQYYVNIEQLMGMWYGVEVISHKHNEERLGSRFVDSCPIIHISEDNSPTVPPFYVGQPIYPYDNNYELNYDQGRYPSTDYNQDPYRTTHSQPSPYGQSNPYGQGVPYQRPVYSGTQQGRQYIDEYQRRYAEDIKRLRLLWDENGNYVEYFLRYNISKSGFWISSGPHNGSALEQQYNQFAGTVQIIKAVGNHLVLTFCRQLPDQQLYTAILSRVPRLSRSELSDVHDLLTKRGLESYNIKKVCANNNAQKFSLNIFVLLSIIFISLIRPT